MADVCATDETIEELTSFVGCISSTGIEDDVRRRRSNSTAYGQQQQQQQQKSDYVARSPTNETDNNSSFMDVFPSMMDVFSLTNSESTISKGSQQKKNNNSRVRSRDQSTITSIPETMNLTITDGTHNNNSKKTNDYDDNSNQTSPSIMNIFSILAPDDTSSRRSSISSVSSQNKDNKIQRDSSSSMGMGIPSIRNVFSMDDGSINRSEERGGETSNSLSQFHPFVRNVFSMNDISMEEGEEERNPSFLSSMRDVEKDNKTPLRSISEEPQQQQQQQQQRRPPSDAGGSVKSTHKILVTRAYEVKEHYLESIFYVSISAILGSVFRVYMARIFGYDCENKDVDDFLTSFTSNICVTTNGQSIQTGGALFIDFPANIFGSFLMGVITPSFSEQRARLPWLHRDHPLQRDEVFHASLGTGLCGCLTSFASWNTQMVVMLDGKYCELGSQVVTVFFGYVLGLMGAICGFQFGRQCGLWMHNFKHRNEEEVDTLHLEESQTVELHSEQQAALHQGIELVDDSNVNLKPVPSHLHKIPLFLAAVCLLVAFIIGDAVNNIEFYRGMTLLWILSPVGSLLRWRLSNLNIRKEGEINTNTPSWIPWGTFGANMTATVIAAFIEGLYSRYFYGADQTSTNKWVIAIFFALKTGVAGSLSTVSTMIKECVYLSEKHAGMAKAHYYTCFTCICGCVLGLIVYASTIRINI